MDFLVDKNIQNKPAVEYCRKSTESEDRQAFSLDDQSNVIKRISAKNLVKIKKTYKESMSAKRRGRPMFNEMVGDIEKGKYEVILCWALNRLARNSVDGAMLIELMDNKKLEAIVTPGKTYYNSGDDKLLLQIEFGLAKKYSDDLGPAVMRGMVSKLNRGWWPGPIKQGYLSKKERGEIIQVVDDERFPLLRKSIEQFIEGSTVDNILDDLNNKWGYKTPATERTGNKPLSKSSFYRILKDSFYYGKMVWSGIEEELDPSVPRLMTEQEYWLIQDKLGCKGIKRPQKHKEVPYRGIIKCSECGSTIIPYVKNKKLASGKVKTYTYAKCSSKKRCNQSPISIPKLEKQLDKILTGIVISKDFHDWFLKWLKNDHQIEATETELLLKKIDVQIESQHKRKNNLLDMRIDGDIKESDYKNKKEEISYEITRLEKERASVKYQSNDWLKRAENRLDYALYAREKLDTGNFEEKTNILAGLGSNFILNHGILCVDLDSVLTTFKNNHETVNQSLEGFELEDKLLLKANQPILDSWLGDRDSNPNIQSQSLKSYH